MKKFEIHAEEKMQNLVENENEMDGKILYF